jgi:sterol desaturase/sphingolipid hydroxylase (fatty acid hydroxylase superfamily)
MKRIAVAFYVWCINISNALISDVAHCCGGFLCGGLIETTKNIILCGWMDYATATTKTTTPVPVERESNLWLHLRYTLPNSFVKFAIHSFLMPTETTTTVTMMTIVTLIPRMFLFELAFDFAHYWIHRLCHENKWLYQNIHKTHHTHHKLTSIQTMIMSPIEVVLVYGIPLLIGTSVVRFSRFEFYLECSFLSYQEFGGHLGRKMRPTSSFPQCVWIPQKLGSIELYSEDHEMHHSLLNCNYGKRFALFDNLFGTFKDSLLKTQQSPLNACPSPSPLSATDSRT